MYGFQYTAFEGRIQPSTACSGPLVVRHFPIQEKYAHPSCRMYDGRMEVVCIRSISQSARNRRPLHFIVKKNQYELANTCACCHTHVLQQIAEVNRVRILGPFLSFPFLMRGLFQAYDIDPIMALRCIDIVPKLTFPSVIPVLAALIAEYIMPLPVIVETVCTSTS